MKVKTLYDYIRPDGGLTSSPIKPNCEYETNYIRLYADEGKCVTDGKHVFECVDIPINDFDKWDDCEEVLDDGNI